MIIRLANAQDARGIAEVHINSWRSTYKGIIADSFLAKLSLDRRIEQWNSTLQHPSNDLFTLVLVDDDSRVMGFIYGGIAREIEAGYDGEVHAIYLLKKVQGRGHGRALLTAFMKHMHAKRYSSVMLWALEQNPAVAFYQVMGGEIIGRKEVEIGEDRLVELAIGWRDIEDSFE